MNIHRIVLKTIQVGRVPVKMDCFRNWYNSNRPKVKLNPLPQLMKYQNSTINIKNDTLHNMEIHYALVCEGLAPVQHGANKLNNWTFHLRGVTNEHRPIKN